MHINDVAEPCFRKLMVEVKMNNLKLVVYISILLLLSTSNLRSQMAGTYVSEDEDLRYLIETSDLIVTGIMKERQPLVDPEKRTKAYDARIDGNLASPKDFMFGYFYNVNVTKILHKKRGLKVAESVSIYSEGSLFSMHSTVVTLFEGREYLIFLSQAKKNDVNTLFRTSDLKGVLSKDQIDYKDVFLVTGGAYGVREIDDKPYLVREVEKLSQDSPSGLENRILSRNHAVAHHVLWQSINERDLDSIKLGLSSQFLDIRIDAVGAIRELKDRSSVSKLVELLKENQGVIDGGTEIQIQQNNLNEAIVRALEHITGLDFAVSNRLASEDVKGYKPFSAREMQEIQSQTRDWCESHKKDL